MSDVNIASMAIMDQYAYANDLSRAAGVHYPDSDESPGGKWLLQVRDMFLEDLERILESDFPEDEARDDDPGPVGTYEAWQVWTDLCLWEFDTALVDMVAWDDITDLPGKVLWEVANNLVGVLLRTAQEADDIRNENFDYDKPGQPLSTDTSYPPR